MIAAVDPERARADAREILDGRRFRSDPAPRPLRGLLEWLGDRLRPIGEALGDIFGLLPWWVWLVIALVAAALVFRAVLPEARRRWAPPGGTGRAARRAVAEDPGALERAAADAERRGDLDRAVRLRFRAGLLRLGARGAIDYSPSITVGEVRREVRSPDFECLASTFEEVAYGDHQAEPRDVDESRRRWPRVLDGSGRP